MTVSGEAVRRYILSMRALPYSMMLPLMLVAGVAPAAESPLLGPLPDAGAAARGFGAHVHRAMALLASSTPEHRNHVRVLVYGQSISEGVWWKAVERDLRERFPAADLEMTNRALGGHAANVLVREAETDVYPYYPDLILFHVYGAHTCYEQLVSRMRSRTAAEVLITDDHLAADEAPDEHGVYVDHDWTAFMAGFIPQVAECYGCELVDVRGPWKRYLVEHRLAAQALLIDGIHLNEHGNALYAALIARQLVATPVAKPDDDRRVRTTEVTNADWRDGKLTLTFDGNRIDALPASGAGPAATVLIDGQPPSRQQGCYAFTRAQGGGMKILCIVPKSLPQVEDWTLRVTEVDRERKRFSFTVVGSKTGPDGAGSSDQRFVSTSGRVVIETAVEKPFMGMESDWLGDAGNVAVGTEIAFGCYATHVDRYAPPAPLDPTREQAVTLAQGLSLGKHTLTLVADGAGQPPLRALRVYRPTVAPPTVMVYDGARPPSH